MRIHQEDHLSSFFAKDDTTEKNAPPGYCFYKTYQTVVFYAIQFKEQTGFPIVREAIKIDQNLHVQLEYFNNPVPLPHWFSYGRNYKFKNYKFKF